MKIAYIILCWLITSISYILLGDSSSIYWDCVFYSKDAIAFILIVRKFITSYTSYLDKKMLVVFIISLLLITGVQDLYILKILHMTRWWHIGIYSLSLLSILIIWGYDRKA